MIKANRRNFLFEEVKQFAPERNGFDLSHENKQTCRAGKIYPFEIHEALPNDDFEIQVEQFIRLSPLLSPTMHRVKSYWHWFFIPNRLCWSKWEEFISRGNGKKLPTDQDYTPPSPQTISMATLLEYGPQSQLFLSDPYSQSFSGSFDDQVTYLTNKHPEMYFRKAAYGTNNGYSCIVVYVRTPRLANALQIPDTLFPIGWYDKDKHLHHAYAAETEGEMTVNQLWNISMISPTEVDIYGYYHSIKLSLMPFIATFRIWLEYYRDENLDEDYSDMLDYFVNMSGEFLPTTQTLKDYCKRLFLLNYRCWEKDYFTTATQLPQKAPDVEIPGTGAISGVSATTTITPTAIAAQTSVNSPYAGSGSAPAGTPLFVQIGSSNASKLVDNSSSEVLHRHNLALSDIANNLSATTTLTTSGSDSSLQPTTVAQVRRAFALQRWFEKVVRTGTRYIESLKAFFNSDAGDARLQRAEYIGGMSTPIQISDVVQTSATDDAGDTPQGNLAGYGIASDSSQVVSYHCPEHGFVIGMFSILARTSYSQGIPRLFSRETWLDYAWPEFEHVGEQGIRQKEIAAFPLASRLIAQHGSPLNIISYASKGNDHIFGYQSRYSEYKQHPDIFGSGFSSSLDFWSLGRIFDAAPSLNADFVHAQVSDRNFAVVGNNVEQSTFDPTAASSEQLDEAYDYDTYQCDFWLDIKKVTSLTLYSEPI